MSIESLSSEDNGKLRRAIEEGVKMKQRHKLEIESFNDTIKAISEDLEIPAKVIKDAITADFKSSLEDMKQHLIDVEHILDVVKAGK